MHRRSCRHVHARVYRRSLVHRHVQTYLGHTSAAGSITELSNILVRESNYQNVAFSDWPMVPWAHVHRVDVVERERERPHRAVGSQKSQRLPVQVQSLFFFSLSGLSFLRCVVQGQTLPNVRTVSTRPLLMAHAFRHVCTQVCMNVCA